MITLERITLTFLPIRPKKRLNCIVVRECVLPLLCVNIARINIMSCVSFSNHFESQTDTVTATRKWLGGFFLLFFVQSEIEILMQKLVLSHTRFCVTMLLVQYKKHFITQPVPIKYLLLLVLKFRYSG